MVPPVIFFATLLACSSEQKLHETASVPTPVGFVDKVWTEVDGEGRHSDMRHVFLTGGTYLRAATDAVPDLGRWSWDGERITIMTSALPYTAVIDSLSNAVFNVTLEQNGRQYQLRLVTALPVMPDTMKSVEFDPARATINASGDNPSWLLKISNETARPRSAQTGTLFYDGGEWFAEEPNRWYYEAYNKADTIRVTIFTVTCTDNPHGIELPIQATLVRGKVRLTGCAVAGKLLPLTRPDDTTP